MKSEITCGKRKILYSETFICADNDSKIHVDLNFNPEYNLITFLEFEFFEDNTVNGGNSKLHVEFQNGGFSFKIYNGENVFGTGNMNPTPIAVLGGKAARLYFRFSRPDIGMPRMFTYTIVLDEEDWSNE